MRWTRITGLLTLEKGDRVTSSSILRLTKGVAPKKIIARQGTLVLQAMHRRELADCEVTGFTGRKWKLGPQSHYHRRVGTPKAEATRAGEEPPVRRKIGTTPVLIEDL